LAFVLSREVAHHSEHHALAALRTQRRGHEALFLVDAAAATLGAYFTSTLIDLGVAGAVRGFAQDRERAADRLGLERLTHARYDGAEAVAFSNALAGEARAGASRAPSAHQPQDLDRALPGSRSRIAALRWRSPAAGADAGDANGYRAQIRAFLAAWLAADLQRRDYGASLYAFDRLAAQGYDLGVAQFYRGEAYRLRRGDGDLAKAEAAYRQAVGYGDAPAAAWRALGELEARAGADAEARAALRTYLERAPLAEDRALIEARLQSLADR